jgi:hypothetical protein
MKSIEKIKKYQIIETRASTFLTLNYYFSYGQGETAYRLKSANYKLPYRILDRHSYHGGEKRCTSKTASELVCSLLRGIDT